MTTDSAKFAPLVIVVRHTALVARRAGIVTPGELWNRNPKEIDMTKPEPNWVRIVCGGVKQRDSVLLRG